MKVTAPPATKTWVILMTDRRQLGAHMRAIPKPRYRQQTTFTMERAMRFATKREARSYLANEVEKDPHFTYIITTA